MNIVLKNSVKNNRVYIYYFFNNLNRFFYYSLCSFLLYPMISKINAITAIITIGI